MANNIKGRTLLLEIWDSSSWKLLGGVQTKTMSRDNPVADATSSSTPSTSNETESCFTGFATETIEASGKIDTRSDSGLSAYKFAAAIAHSNAPEVTLRFSNSLETINGPFLITSWEVNSEENGLVDFSASFQNAGELTYA